MVLFPRLGGSYLFCAEPGTAVYRYILKLFRDYVFHSIGLDGHPVLDLSHVLTCLNKVSFVKGNALFQVVIAQSEKLICIRISLVK